MTLDDVRLTAQLVAAGRVFSVSDASMVAMARRVLELEELLERHAFVGKGDPVEWSPVPDDVVLAVCVDYREKVMAALKAWAAGDLDRESWPSVVMGVRMLGRQVTDARAEKAEAERATASADAKRWQTAFEAQNHARSFDLHRERDEARAERDLAQRAATHWEGVAAANALDVVTEVAAEREACAALVESKAHAWRSSREPHWSTYEYLASQIRARATTSKATP